MEQLLKKETLKCLFVSNPDSPYFQSNVFTGLLNFIQTQTNKAKLKQVGKNGILIVENVERMAELYKFLERAVTHTQK